MKLRELMTATPIGINSDATLTEASMRMAELDTGFLPVNETGRAVGVVTDRDIVVRGIAQGGDPQRTFVKTIMSPGVATASVNDEAEVAASTMKERQIRRLLVLDEENQVAGIVSLADLARGAHDSELTGSLVEEISKPAASR